MNDARSHVVARKGSWPLAFILTIVLLKVLSSPVTGQTMYSDTWTELGSATVYGCGITDAAYTTTFHNVRVTTTLTSPNGRISSASSTYSGSYARADVSLVALEGDEGDYTTQSSHEGTCTHYGGSHLVTGFTQRLVKVGYTAVSHARQYTTIHGTAYYRKVSPCNVRCASLAVESFEIGNDVTQASCHTQLHFWTQYPNGSVYCTIYGIGRMHEGPCVCAGVAP
jgi:hypothetical protein